MDETPINVYDTRLIQIHEFNMTQGTPIKVGKHHLEVDTFTYSWPDSNYIGFAFDQDLFESSYMCGSC